jgi:hypothetical protein
MVNLAELSTADRFVIVVLVFLALAVFLYLLDVLLGHVIDRLDDW